MRGSIWLNNVTGATLASNPFNLGISLSVNLYIMPAIIVLGTDRTRQVFLLDDVIGCCTAHLPLKPGFHSNASACVGKQPIMVATASIEHSYWLALAYATHATQAIAFECKPGLNTIVIVSLPSLLHTPTLTVGVGRIVESVCLSVCLSTA